jgi:hypothetical protein
LVLSCRAEEGNSMMGLRRASLLVAFSMLASAATAYAECAWVLWQTQEVVDRFETRSGNEVAIVHNEGFVPVSAYTSKQDCDSTLNSRREPWPTSPLVVGERRKAHICFPDTLDPRGPKGR